MSEDGSLTADGKYRKAVEDYAREVVGIETDCRRSMSSYQGVANWPHEKQEWRRQAIATLKHLAVEAGISDEEHFDFLRRRYDELRVRVRE